MSRLLFVVTFTICCFQVYSIEIPDKYFDQDHLKCIDDLKVDKQIVGENINDKFHLPKGNEDLNKFLVCVCTVKGVFDEDGVIKKDAIREDLVNVVIPVMGKQSSNDRELADNAVEECKDIQNSKMEDKIIDLHNCIVDAINKLTK